MPAAVPIAIGVAAIVGGGVNAYYGYKGSMRAARMQRDSANKASDTQLRMFEQTRADNQPWLDSGKDALGKMNEAFARGDFSKEYGGSFDPGSFDGGSFDASQYKEPTYEGVGAFDPNSILLDKGSQFRMDQGIQGLDRSASSRGGVLGGGQKKAVLSFSQGLASEEYGNAFNRAYGAYSNQRQFDYNRFLGDQNQFNTNRGFGYNKFSNDRNFNYGNFVGNRDFGYNSFLNDRNLFYGNQNQAFNRYASMSGVGQATAQNLGQLRSSLGAQLGDNITGAGNAMAAGAVGSANAISGGINSGINGVTNAFLLSQMGKGGVK
jgi:hypothetical protein